MVDLEAVLGDRAQLHVDLRHELVILFGRKLLAGRADVDQPSDDAGLGVRDLDRAVRAHEQKAVRPGGVGRLELLVHRHLLVRDDRIELGVVLDAGEVAVVLNGDQRIGLEDLSGEGVVVAGERLGLERRVIAREELLHDVEHGRLAGARLAVEHDELLDVLRLARHDRPDRPFDLRALIGRIELPDQLVVGRIIAGFERVGKAAADIVGLLDFRVGKGELVVERMSVVGQVLQVILELRPASGGEIAHQPELDHPLLLRHALVVFVNIRIDEALDVVLVRRPEPRRFVPDGVE